MQIVVIVVIAAVCIVLVMLHMLRDSRRIQKLMYKDADFNIWNINYLKYRASLKLGTDADKNMSPCVHGYLSV